MNIVGEVWVEIYGADGILKERRYSKNSIVDGAKITTTYASGYANANYRMVKGIELYSGGTLKDKNYTCGSCSTQNTHHTPSYNVDSVTFGNDSSSAWFEVVATITASSDYSLDEERLVTVDCYCDFNANLSPVITTFAKHTESSSISVQNGDKVKVTWKVTIS